MPRTARVLALGGLATLASRTPPPRPRRPGFTSSGRTPRWSREARQLRLANPRRGPHRVLRRQQTTAPGELIVGGRPLPVGGGFVPVTGATVTAEIPRTLPARQAGRGEKPIVGVELTDAHRTTRLALPDGATFGLEGPGLTPVGKPGLRSLTATFDGPRRIVAIEAVRACALSPGFFRARCG